MYRGQRVYDARTGRYIGRSRGPYGSAYVRVVGTNKQEKKIRTDKVR